MQSLVMLSNGSCFACQYHSQVELKSYWPVVVASHHLFSLPHRDKETFSEVDFLRHDFTTSSVVRQLGFNIQIDHE
jgi:hypothetical protein